MAERASVFNASYWGIETVPGTQVAPTKRLLATGLEPEPITPTTAFRPLGFLAPTTVTQGKENVNGNLSGDLSFSDLTYLYNSILVAVSPTTPAGATLTRRWTFQPSVSAPDAFKSYTIQRGSTAGAELWGYTMIDSLTHRWTRTEATQTGTFFGQIMTEQAQSSPFPIGSGVTDVTPLPIDPKSVSLYAGTSFTTSQAQTITLSGGATGGTFTLTFDGQTTAPIAFNATGATVQTALQALSTINTNNVTVTGSAGGPWVATFADRLAFLDVSLFTFNLSLLTGGTPAMTVVKTTPGSMSKLLRVSSFEYAMPSRFTPGFTLNQGDPSFSYFVNKGIEPVHTLVLEHDSVSAGFMSNLRNKTQTYLCLIAWGPQTEAGFSNCLRMFVPFKFTQSVRGDTDDVYTATYSLSNQYDATLGSYAKIEIDNAISAL